MRRGLCFAKIGAIVSAVMQHWSVRRSRVARKRRVLFGQRHAPIQIATLLLAVFLAVGMGTSFAQASGMAARMATMPDMAQSEMVMPEMAMPETVAAPHGDCQDCPAQPDGMKAMTCGNVCAAPVVAPLPLAAVVPDGEKPASVAAVVPPLDGQTLPPDPDPPRTSDIG